MRLLVPLGLLVALAVVGPFLAHLLRRRRPQERVFPAARLVPTAPPVARRRANLEDRALLAVRAIAVLALALLAASPLVRCSRLSLDRRGGASIALAIVIDDSMSMRAELPSSAQRGGAKTRFDLAMVAAQELARSLRAGDVTTIILAGSPARVALAPTGEAASVRALLDRLAVEGSSDRATDLDGALALAASALHDLPHADRRIVLLSDLADGQSSSGPIVAPTLERTSVEAPVDALRSTPPSSLGDCAAIAATPEGADAVRVRIACALHGSIVGDRGVDVVIDDATHARVGGVAFPASVPDAPQTFDVVVPVEASKAGSIEPTSPKPALLAMLRHDASGKAHDAIAEDDVAPVLGAATAPEIAVVVGEAGALDEIVATGGPPILERALEALDTGAAIRPLPSLPDRDVDLSSFAALALDDPPGFTPEERDALGKWVERGGVFLLALGPRAASPPLGQSLEPFLQRGVRWDRVSAPLGIDANKAGPFSDGTTAPNDLAAKGRTIFDREDLEHVTTSAAWSDASPLLVTRSIGQGEAWIVGVPFAPDVSDLPLRPAFLAMLSDLVDRATDRGAGARLEIGKSWSAGPDDTLEAIALDGEGKPMQTPIPVERTPAAIRVTPRTIGAYLVTLTPKGGSPRKDLRAVAPIAKEVDLTPRALPESIVAGDKSGLQRTTTELAPAIAWVLLLLATAEIAFRIWRIFAPKPEEDAKVAV
jgi:hypothetical protein